jgi:hypothetical protein
MAPAESGPTTIAFTSPTPGAMLVRDALAMTGSLVADAPVATTIAGSPARVELTLGSTVIGDLDATGALAVQLAALGPATLTATAYDAAGTALATASVDVNVIDPTVADCHGWLDLYRIEYTLGPANQGVADPVTIKVPFNGLTYRVLGATNPRKTFFMDCSLARSLAQATPILRAHDVVEVDDLGVYNYRCIGNTGTPPNCPNGMSQHAYAKAIDLAAFVSADNTTYTVKTDFVIDPTAMKTCAADTVPGKDAWLHETICALKDAKVWNIVLTPNYNADHRDHFHVDLTPGSDFIRRTTGPVETDD